VCSAAILYILFFLHSLWNFFLVFTLYRFINFFLPISFVLFLCTHICFILIHFHQSSSLFSFLCSILFINNMLLSVTNLISCFLSVIVLITQFWLHKIIFPSLYCFSHIFFSQFFDLHHFSILSSLCFVGSLLIALTARNQYIPFHISYPYFEPSFQPLPLILTHQSHNATTLTHIHSSSFLFHSIFFNS